MLNNMEQLYNERLNRIITTSNHQEPDRVPVVGMMNTWPISYAGSTVRECLDNPDKALTDVYAKCHRDIYFDATAEPILVPANVQLLEALGQSTTFISEDGLTLQHDEAKTVVMDPKDYDKLIDDPINFMVSHLGRKFPDLTIEKLSIVAKELINNNIRMEKYSNYFKEELGLPIFYQRDVGGYVYPPLDFLFDWLRGFKGLSIDIRRRPQQLLDAMDAVYPMLDKLIGIEEGTIGLNPFPFVCTMMHIPTFISNKQFLKFFAPLYEKMITKVHKAGKKMYIFLEGSWEKHYDWLNSLPKDFIIGLVEHDDFIEAKKKIGNNITIMGGMPMALLKYGTKQECIDHAKMVVDACAPGGGFIFSTDKCLLSPGDVKVENLREVNQFVHEYGVYK